MKCIKKVTYTYRYSITHESGTEIEGELPKKTDVDACEITFDEVFEHIKSEIVEAYVATDNGNILFYKNADFRNHVELWFELPPTKRGELSSEEKVQEFFEKYRDEFQ